MAIEVFNRYEKKYIMDEDTFHKLTYQIADYMNPDAHNRNGEAYRISNIYYDTENDQLIRASIEKPVYKEKLRLRNGNLNITMGTMPNSDGGNLN